MSTLGQKPATTHVSFQKQTITGNGGTSYTLQQSVGSELDIAVFVNNTRQEPTTAYTASGTSLVMTGAVNSSDSFYVMFLAKAINTTGLPLSAVNTANINASAVTDAKIAGMAASKLTGAMPALDGSALTKSGGLKSVQVFTSSGTYTKPTGISTVKVIVTGAGGSGGGHGDTDDMGAGGGAGGTAIEVIDISSVSTVTVTIGTGGTSVSGGNSGNQGGTSSFGSFCSATGGQGGHHGNLGEGVGGTGGVGSGGDINIYGGSGSNGWDNFNVTNTYARGFGHGGASFWGGGGRGSSKNVHAAEAGNAYGSGGGAPHSRHGGNSGAGKAGVVYIEEYA